MKKRHNKKRNTAFLFEVLSVELTKSIIKKDTERTQQIKNIFKKSFNTGTNLYQEMQCYGALEPGQNLDRRSAEKLIFLTKQKHSSIDQKKVFAEQSTVIKEINHSLGKDVYQNFVKNYKNYANLSQIFGTSLAPKEQMLLEDRVASSLGGVTENKLEMKPVDSLVVKTFIDKFNSTYSDLLPEQSTLLQRYILSISPDESIDFKAYLMSEVKRLRGEIKKSLELEEIKEDKEMQQNTQKVLEKIETFDVLNFDEKSILKMLQLQNLVSECKK